ncbi:histidine phosphatase family protein [Shewanella sp. CG12_big_fil_rev_8_21_14_0_65_47_15]|uniref:histidine phosphatase family protein n=1 Tax=Shewanella sp. CG12_big_fil_rev_8_21_14_0_65_47_15 TaxID=1975537 RepID=UPI000CB44155|nr:histidine phosphatase family protein [Shewanella sp. CG12_big_fil_rev_8_21_14_0_65_47_15]PIW61837.1 MAG: phosphoglycerate mutase [Shewanella sp. CG12_big_fil_rev_8_21_14_0_65_47_15]
MKQVRLLLLRHGECEGGAILRGRVDVPLSEKGWRQMSAAIEARPGIFHGIYSSTSRRCAEFAKAFADSLSEKGQNPHVSNPLVVTLLDSLQELDFGDWDGRTLEELYRQEGELLAAYWQNPWLAPPPRGESMASFEQRINATIEGILDQAFAGMPQHYQAPPAELSKTLTVDANTTQVTTIWVISHGGVLRHLMARALGAVQVPGFYSQLTLPEAAVVGINVLEDALGERYWRLDWPSAKSMCT